MSLVKELISPLLEEEKKVVAVYGGGFKPPTAGHFEVVDQALKEKLELCVERLGDRDAGIRANALQMI